MKYLQEYLQNLKIYVREDTNLKSYWQGLLEYIQIDINKNTKLKNYWTESFPKNFVENIENLYKKLNEKQKNLYKYDIIKKYKILQRLKKPKQDATLYTILELLMSHSEFLFNEFPCLSDEEYAYHKLNYQYYLFTICYQTLDYAYNVVAKRLMPLFILDGLKRYINHPTTESLNSLLDQLKKYNENIPDDITNDEELEYFLENIHMDEAKIKNKKLEDTLEYNIKKTFVKPFIKDAYMYLIMFTNLLCNLHNNNIKNYLYTSSEFRPKFVPGLNTLTNSNDLEKLKYINLPNTKDLDNLEEMTNIKKIEDLKKITLALAVILQKIIDVKYIDNMEGLYNIKELDKLNKIVEELGEIKFKEIEKNLDCKQKNL